MVKTTCLSDSATPNLGEQMRSARAKYLRRQKAKQKLKDMDVKPEVNKCSVCCTPRNSRPCVLCHEEQSAVDKDLAKLKEWEIRHRVVVQRTLPFRLSNGQLPVSQGTRRRKLFVHYPYR